MYDYWLGGKDNYLADRELAEQVIQQTPQIVLAVRANRDFLSRAVRYLAGEAGIRQFIDIGSGLPTQENVHEVAQEVDPACRVVYVDHDPVVIAHAEALLATNERTTVVKADLRRPHEILGHPQVLEAIDFDRPVAVLMVAVLHFVTEDEDPYGIVATVRDALPEGSHLVLSHAEMRPEFAGILRQVNERRPPTVPRAEAEIARFFTGLELLEPGLVSPLLWRPGIMPVDPPDTATFAGVAVKTGDPGS